MKLKSSSPFVYFSLKPCPLKNISKCKNKNNIFHARKAYQKFGQRIAIVSGHKIPTLDKTNLGNSIEVLNGHYFKLLIRKMTIPMKPITNNICLTKKKGIG